MLIRFKVGNYLSFKDTEEFSMISGETRNHPDHLMDLDRVKLLKLSAIYGANASGKSNFVKAIAESRDMITKGRSLRSNRCYRLDSQFKDEPSYFEYEFEYDGKFYSYGFEYGSSKQRVESEWLYEFPQGADVKVIFQRTGEKITHAFEGNDKARMDIYAEDMQRSQNKLFLFVMRDKIRKTDVGLQVFSSVFMWFEFNLVIYGSNSAFYTVNAISEPKLTVDVIEKLSTFGTGITGIIYERLETDKDVFPNEVISIIKEGLVTIKHESSIKDPCIDMRHGSEIYRMSLSNEDELHIEKAFFKHGVVNFNSEEESFGSKKIYELLKTTLSEDEERTFIMDELDIGLHPHLSRKFVETFVGMNKGCNSQLVFTTHETYLMDFDLLRRDEVWFVDKDDSGQTSLFSLEDFNERGDRKIEKAYLEGRYGGIPVFSELIRECDQ